MEGDVAPLRVPKRLEWCFENQYVGTALLVVLAWAMIHGHSSETVAHNNQKMISRSVKTIAKSVRVPVPAPNEKMRVAGLSHWPAWHCPTTPERLIAFAFGNVFAGLVPKGLATVLAAKEILLPLGGEARRGILQTKTDAAKIVIVITHITSRYRACVGCGRGTLDDATADRDRQCEQERQNRNPPQDSLYAAHF
jgi:hypothetical protein